ncbi:hypothetical protein L7F22_021834, partial [Adiantum nelumboides]|nr:hypothetical protein [Adiantum nelumboides]
SSSKKKREPQVLSTKSNDSFDVVKGDLITEVISKEFEWGATINACFDKEETNCNLEEELEPLGSNCCRWLKPVGLKGVLKIMSTLRRIGFSHKVRIGKELVLVIQSLAFFPAMQSDEYANLGVVPQEPSVGLGANDDTGGDVPGKEGTSTSGWTRWKDV